MVSERDKLIQRIDTLHAQAWSEVIKVKVWAIEAEIAKLRGELRRMDKRNA